MNESEKSAVDCVAAVENAASQGSNPKQHRNDEVLKVNIPTTRFGTLEVASDRVVTFPDGVIGFENYKRYTLVQQSGQAAFSWLQSLDEPKVAFPLMEPGSFRPDYRLRLSESDTNTLRLDTQTKPQIFAILTIPAGNPRGMTANLLAPLVINSATQIGKQIIVMNEEFTTRHEVVRELEQAAAKRAGAPDPYPKAQSHGASIQNGSLTRLEKSGRYS